MKFVTNVGVGRKVEAYLLEAGYDVRSILDVNAELPDVEILRIAEEEQRIVVTMDKDFGELVYRSGRRHVGVLLLRLEAATGAEKVEVVRQIMERYGAELSNAFCVFQNGRLRIR